MPSAKLSIIVPCYNVSNYIDECLASITSQTYSHIEIILIDDGSTDNTGERCASWAQQDKRIIVIHQQNQGLSAARNTGLDMATGDYILYVDSDDRIAPTLSLQCMNALERESADMVFYGHNIIDPHNNSIKAVPIRCTSGDQVMTSLLSNVIRSYSWQFICKKKLYEGIRFPTGRKAEDLSTTYLLVDKADRISVLSDCLYDYRRHDNSIIGDTLNNSQHAIRYYQDEIQAFQEIKLWASTHKNSTYYKLIINTMFRHLFLHYNQMISSKNMIGISWIKNSILIEEHDINQHYLFPKTAFQLLLLKTGVLYWYNAVREFIKKHIKVWMR